ncbi:MAG TPA: DUF882 domain-containing protein [Methylobacterium sp.]|uniref:YcbK family protein n=1 Tax=Methylorubrum sp. B1-46 TaxID=2897334 RepID=UPI001E40A235|nr:DUF882 domain-containing protein [Methylorubrum sp. B1-46]UGB26533.1 DUF882 domain-containing protein [Methylorubrum sp. B1-46]HEV2541144.1 DUF882 domain-containing protein [Methylobacterium sp.]
MAGASEPLRDAPAGRDRLWLMRPDGTEVSSRFRTAEGYDRPQMLLLSWFMRDIHDDDRAVWMEPRLFDILAGVQASMSAVHGSALPLVVTSGYRTPRHNAALENAARTSMHLYGYAADVQVRGYPPRAVALAASFFSEGGIGLYDTFTHLDVWQRRRWSSGRPDFVREPGTAGQ